MEKITMTVFPDLTTSKTLNQELISSFFVQLLAILGHQAQFNKAQPFLIVLIKKKTCVRSD